METAKEIFEYLKKPLIIIGIFAIVMVIVTKIVPAVRNAQISGSPVVSIEAENSKSYSVGTKLKKSDFDVKATHENGKVSSIDSEDFELSKSRVNNYGKTTEIEISLKDHPEISCKVKVKNKRDEVARFECGSPSISDAYAILYSNGELCFEGEGDILQFEEGNFPWQSNDTDTEITSITFSDSIRPLNMDFWFAGMDTITYCAPLPESVQSMSGTFEDCAGIKEGPDWSKCVELLDLSSCFSGCESLTRVYAIPGTVKNINEVCYGCISLQTAPDLEGAEGVETAVSAFEDCSKLTKATIPPNARVLSSTFRGCINLPDMPDIPQSALYMDNTFNGDVSLRKLTSIPSGVQDTSNCFNGCTKIKGTLIVDAEPDSYNSMFSGAATATTVDLQGSSRMLDVLANTCDSLNVKVNGNAPDADATVKDEMIE